MERKRSLEWRYKVGVSLKTTTTRRRHRCTVSHQLPVPHLPLAYKLGSSDYETTEHRKYMLELLHKS